MLLTLEPNSKVNPLWWRIPVWIALTAVSVIQTHSVAARIAGGILMGSGALILQVVSIDHRSVRRVAVVAVTVLGLAGTFAMHNGLSEIVVVVAAMRAPRALDGVSLRWYTVLTSVAFGATVGIISHSLPGVLAGTGIPLLVERELEQQRVIRERDRAQALLVELQNARDEETQAAALRERGRIAREMHDVLAHSLAGLSVQLQAIRAVAAREQVGPKVLEPLDKAAQLAKDGVAEARAAVSTLRDPVGLGLTELPALIDRHPGTAGLTVTGLPGSVAPKAGHAAYRAVQEALTNSARYAPGSPVSVALAWTADLLTVTVEDDGPLPGREAVAGQGTGLGLAGMTERVTGAGGSVTSGPRAPRGWRTRLELPAQPLDRPIEGATT